MGAAKSITHSYADRQYLFWYIERNDIANVEALLQKKPQLINQSLTINYKTTPLHRAACNGDLALVQLLLDKYQADANLKTQGGDTALIGAIKRNKIEIVISLLRYNANSEFVSDAGLKPIDYAILQGFYDIALLLYERSNQTDLKDPIQYSNLAKIYKYRYVNYQAFIDQLKLQIDPDNTRDFLTKRKIVYNDPVVDPRQSWKQWLLRNLDFKDPPMIERSDLPEELQPQNRRLGKLRHLLTRLTISRMSQTPNYEPQNMSEESSNNKMCIVKEEEMLGRLEVNSMA